MDPRSEKTPGLHLPQPSVNEGMPFRASYEDMPGPEPVSPEIKRDVTSVTPADGSNMPLQTLPTVTDDPSTSSVTDDQTQAGAGPDDAADELDREWVNKAKFIVEQTKTDPYMQSREIGKAKADYLRIRYNKHIKVSPDQTL